MYICIYFCGSGCFGKKFEECRSHTSLSYLVEGLQQQKYGT